MHKPCPGGLRVPNQPHGSVKPHQPLPIRTLQRQSQVALDPHTNVWTITSAFRRRNPLTWYKGKLYTAQMLGVTPLPWQPHKDSPAPSGAQNVPPPAKIRKNRLQGLSWNIGSLSSYKFDQRIDLLLLQDTRWGFTGDWSDNTFAYIHSGSQDRAGGLMTIIRKDFCPPDKTSWWEVLGGRLLHARLYLDSTGIDLVNLYQRPWTGSDNQCKDKRSGLLNTCDGLLAGLPQRNVVILAGDFNTNLRKSMKHVIVLISVT